MRIQVKKSNVVYTINEDDLGKWEIQGFEKLVIKKKPGRPKKEEE